MKLSNKNKSKTNEKLLEYPAWAKLLQFRDKVANRMLTALLAFFDLIGPLLTYLCTKKPDTENETNNGIM